MRTTLKKQAAAVKKAMDAREKIFKPTWKKDMNGFRMHDKQWLSLNDAYSTLVSLQLLKSVAKTMQD